jgi:hypothetical protein
VEKSRYLGIHGEMNIALIKKLEADEFNEIPAALCY